MDQELCRDESEAPPLEGEGVCGGCGGPEGLHRVGGYRCTCRPGCCCREYSPEGQLCAGCGTPLALVDPVVYVHGRDYCCYACAEQRDGGAA